VFEDSLSLNPFREFCCHARVHLNCSDMFCFLEYSNGQVSGSRANFEDFVGGSKVSLSHSLLFNRRDPSNMIFHSPYRQY
jgi:hypothetical protein